MIVATRLRQLREAKNLSQGDIEKRTGLLRCYLSRVENGHTVPSVETIEKLARALEVPVYQIFYDGEEPPQAPPIKPDGKRDEWGSAGAGARFMTRLGGLLSRMEQRDRNLLMHIASKVSVR